MEAMHENEILDGRYRLIQKKGAGSFGEVWLARDVQLDIDVAVKVYYSLDEAGNQELMSEFLTTHDLNHPNLLRALHYGRCEGRTYMVMPYCPTTSAQLIGCFNNQMAWEFVYDVASGLAYLHQCGIVHHDIKPDNILIGVKGQYVISDFGISTSTRSTLRHQAEQKDNNQQLEGSIAYMGPEMFLEQPFSADATDIWAFGASLYEILTGTLPFFGQGGGMQNSGAQLPEVPFDFVSPDLVDMLHACLEKETWMRPRADEMAQYARMVLDDAATAPKWADFFREARGGGEVTVDPKPRNRVWIGIAAAAAALAVLIGLGWVYFFGDNEKQPNLVDTRPDASSVPMAAAMPSVQQVAASYLKVNGSERPKPITIPSNDTLMVVMVDTDGSFTVDSTNLPQWMTLAMVTDTSIVFRLDRNNSAQKLSKTFEIKSGSIVRKVTIVHSPDKAKELKSKLTPASSGLEDTKKGLESEEENNMPSPEESSNQ